MDHTALNYNYAGFDVDKAIQVVCCASAPTLDVDNAVQVEVNTRPWRHSRQYSNLNAAFVRIAISRLRISCAAALIVL